MKRSKIPLLFKTFTFILIFFSLISVFHFLKKYKFDKSSGKNTGTVTMVSKKDGYSVANIKSNINYKAYIDIENDIDYGDKIEFEYSNKEVYKNTIFNTFNYKNYLKSKNINQVIIIKNYKKIGIHKYYKFRGYIYKHILKRKSSAYILNFICGDKSYLDNDIKMSYMNNGISHLLCVSGFHVSFLFGTFLALLKRYIKSTTIPLVLIAVLSLFYLLLTNFMIALFRATIMFLLSNIKKFNLIKIRAIYSLLFALALSLILWPNVVYDIGFYYTYVLTFYLIMHKSGFKNLFQITLYSFIISLPITVYLNYSFNILGIIYSILASYIVCYLLYPFSFIAIFFNFADSILYKVAHLFEIINLKLNSVNIFRVVVPKINIYLVISIYIIYSLYLLFHNKYLIVTYIFIMFYMIFNKYFDNSYYVYFVDVRQGDMSVIISKNYKNVTVIDTGGIVGDKYLKYSTKQFLYSIGVKKINNLILSHGDYDHMGEAINLVKNFKVDNVIFNCGTFDKLESSLINRINKFNINYQYCINKLENMIFLNSNIYNDENNNSSVVLFSINNYKFLFMGDAGIKREEDILNKYNLNNIDVLKVGHHGSNTSSSNKFITKINPKYSIISVGKNNKYGHPNKEVLDNLENSKIYRTDMDGSIIFKIENNKLKIVTCAP